MSKWLCALRIEINKHVVKSEQDAYPSPSRVLRVFGPCANTTAQERHERVGWNSAGGVGTDRAMGWRGRPSHIMGYMFTYLT